MVSVAIRADADAVIGHGHLMRCLTLAHNLQASGAQVYFICADTSDAAHDLIDTAQFNLQVIPAGLSAQADAQQCINVLKRTHPDWVILDHYDLGPNWQAACHQALPDTKILAFEDIPGRAHNADMVLDPTYGRTSAEYAALVRPDTRLLLGTEYALLSDHFAALRPQSLARRATPLEGKTFQVMISLGGGETSYAILECLKSLALAALPPQTTVTLLLGGGQAERALIDETARALPCPVDIFEHRRDMAQLMANTDLVIGAAGGTSWERCCLGVPAILLELADNQKDIIKCLTAQGAAWHTDISASAIAQKLNAVLDDPACLPAASIAAAGLCDGQGAARVRREMLTQLISLRRARTEDIPFVWHARYDDAAHKYYRSTQIPNLQEHTDWMTRAMTRDDIILGIVELSGSPMAHIRLDRLPYHPDHAELSIYLSSAMRGKKMAKSVLQAAIGWTKEFGITKILAKVHTENSASLNCFLSTGFTLTSTDPSGFHYLTSVPKLY